MSWATIWDSSTPPTVSAGREYLAWERWLLGWVNDDQVICASRGQTSATLSPVETPGGTKLLVVPTGSTTAVVVESRHALGYDNNLPKQACSSTSSTPRSRADMEP